ncbi:MAG: hypothetical protein ABI776_09275 [Nocardioidaceae bacterium]
MNKHTVDTMTTAALRDLDPAPTTALTDAELERADATLARILATPRPDHLPEESDRPRRRRSLVLVGLVGAAGAAVLALLVGGGSTFASWTPKPEPLAAATVAASTCRAALEVPDQGERVVSAERRGGWTFVLITGPQAEGACLMPDDLVGHQDPADHKEEGFFGTYDPDPVKAPTLARDRILETESMNGSVHTSGLWPFQQRRGVVQLGPGLCGQRRHRCHRAPPSGSRRRGFRRPWAVRRLVAIGPPQQREPRRDGSVDLHRDPRRRQHATSHGLIPAQRTGTVSASRLRP